MSIRDKEGKLAITMMGLIDGRLDIKRLVRPLCWPLMIVLELLMLLLCWCLALRWTRAAGIVADWATMNLPDSSWYWSNAEAGRIANRYDATPAEMVETIRELREALDGICEQAQDHPAFLPACFDDRDFDTIEQVGGDSADWTLIAIMADDALCKTAKYEETK